MEHRRRHQPLVSPQRNLNHLLGQHHGEDDATALITALGCGIAATGALLLTAAGAGPAELDAGTSLVGAGVALPFSAWLLHKAEERWTERRRVYARLRDLEMRRRLTPLAR